MERDNINEQPRYVISVRRRCGAKPKYVAYYERGIISRRVLGAMSGYIRNRHCAAQARHVAHERPGRQSGQVEVILRMSRQIMELQRPREVLQREIERYKGRMNQEKITAQRGIAALSQQLGGQYQHNQGTESIYCCPCFSKKRAGSDIRRSFVITPKLSSAGKRRAGQITQGQLWKRPRFSHTARGPGAGGGYAEAPAAQGARSWHGAYLHRISSADKGEAARTLKDPGITQERSINIAEDSLRPPRYRRSRREQVPLAG
jgi:hypothetical protein